MFTINQKVSYTNGQPCVYTGVIVKITGEYLTVIDNAAGMELWNAGYAVGSYIHISQVVNSIS